MEDYTVVVPIKMCIVEATSGQDAREIALMTVSRILDKVENQCNVQRAWIPWRDEGISTEHL